MRGSEVLAETTLRNEEGGEGYELRCPGQYEAQIIDYTSVFAVAVDLGHSSAR